MVEPKFKKYHLHVPEGTGGPGRPVNRAFVSAAHLSTGIVTFGGEGGSNHGLVVRTADRVAGLIPE